MLKLGKHLLGKRLINPEFFGALSASSLGAEMKSVDLLQMIGRKLHHTPYEDCDEKMCEWDNLELSHFDIKFNAHFKTMFSILFV